MIPGKMAAFALCTRGGIPAELCRIRVLDPWQPVSEKAKQDPIPTLFQQISDVGLMYTLFRHWLDAAIQCVHKISGAP